MAWRQESDGGLRRFDAQLRGRRLRPLRVGSGTSIIAAERQNRTCYAMGIDPAYVDAAVTRWETYTGGAATKDGKRGNDGG